MKATAEGWYRDPYVLHQDRWFSDGQPTKLVRDDGQESYDEPPDAPLPETELVPAESGEHGDRSDLLRADTASNQPSSAEAVQSATFTVWNMDWPI
ncbi:MAG TPA: hypothetical protein VMA32_03200 [Streptosporangiaceae bacterium]|nr:hypothetical protein [Streptosporangiaceae bacterium]